MALLPVLLAGNVLKPAGIVTFLGVDLTVFAVGILLAATAVQFLRRPYYPLKELLPFLFFAFVVLLGVAASDPSGEYQALKMRDFFFLTGVIVACIPVVLRDVRDLRGLIFTWLLAGTIAACTVLLVGGSDTLYGRAGIGESTLGPAYLAAAGLVVAVTGWTERHIHWGLAVPAIGLTALAVVTIGSRGPLLSAIAGLGAWVLMSGVVRGRAVWAALAFGAAILFGVRQASEQSLSRLFLFEDVARETLRAEAWMEFLNHPILGIGWGDFANVNSGNYPHNALLEVASELGLIGIVAFVAMLLVGALRTWRSRSIREVRVLAAVAAVALVGQQFSSDLTNRSFWISLIPTLLLGSVVRDREPSRAAPEKVL